MSREAAHDILSIAALAHPCASQGPRAAGMRPSRIAASRRRRTAAVWRALKEAAV